jgi:uncharacterized protein
MITLLIRINRTFIPLAILCCACLFVVCASRARAQTPTPEFQVPQSTGDAVNDFAGVIDAQTKQRLETILINLKREQKIEFAVVTVRNTGGRDIFDYAYALGMQWGIGPAEGNKEGLLLVAAIDDKRYHTLVSRHLQGELTDGVVGSIQRQYLVPAFRAGNYGQGLMDTVRAYIDTLAEKRGFSTTGIYGAENTTTRRRPTTQPRRTSTGSGISTCGLVIIVIIVLIVLVLSNRGGGGSGCLNLFLLGSLLNSGSRGGWGSSDWGSSGGGFGGSSGGGGGGFGGFGGGGDFDGGGAGGSW